MGRLAVALVVLCLGRGGLAQKVDPTAPCDSHNDTCCYSNSTPPVFAGIDFVDLAAKSQGVDAPILGTSEFSTTLNGFSFFFATAVNRDVFVSDPWTYAPSWGAF